VLRLERRLGRAIERPQAARERRFARRASRLGEPQTLLLGLGALYLAGNRTDRRAARDSLVVAVQVSLTARLTKMLFGRARPRQGKGEFRGPTLSADSFPSGHTALAFGVAAAYSRHRPAASSLARGLAALVGWSRVAEGAHWPGDVAAAAALGLALGQ
jgi:undecaprenyl-diphosphatase